MIGIGVDVVEVERFRTTLARTPSIRTRMFTPGELADSHDQPQRLAVRFAAKEAVMKALGVGLGAFGFHDVEVVRADSGQPFLRLSGAAATLSSERGVTRWHLSLTHTDLIAEAVAIAE